MTTICHKCNRVFDVEAHKGVCPNCRTETPAPPEAKDPPEPATPSMSIGAPIPGENRFLVGIAGRTIYIGNRGGLSTLSRADAMHLAASLVIAVKGVEPAEGEPSFRDLTAQNFTEIQMED